MREIKFRAWDNTLNEYRTLDMNRNNQNLGMGFDVKGGIGSNINTIYCSVGDTIEQYTGLKDINGVEIYENDIIKTVKEDVDFENEVYQIVYNETGDYPAFDLKGWRGEINGISELSANYGIKVISNIHDQPELLEDK